MMIAYPVRQGLYQHVELDFGCFFVNSTRVKCCTAWGVGGVGSLIRSVWRMTALSKLKVKAMSFQHILLLICIRVRNREIDNA